MFLAHQNRSDVTNKRGKVNESANNGTQIIYQIITKIKWPNNDIVNIMMISFLMRSRRRRRRGRRKKEEENNN